jgi:hypothetical protein
LLVICIVLLLPVRVMLILTESNDPEDFRHLPTRTMAWSKPIDGQVILPAVLDGEDLPDTLPLVRLHV